MSTTKKLTGELVAGDRITVNLPVVVTVVSVEPKADRKPNEASHVITVRLRNGEIATIPQGSKVPVDVWPQRG